MSQFTISKCPNFFKMSQRSQNVPTYSLITSQFSMSKRPNNLKMSQLSYESYEISGKLRKMQKVAGNCGKKKKLQEVAIPQLPQIYCAIDYCFFKIK